MSVRLSRAGCDYSPDDVHRHHHEFADKHCVVLPDLLAPDLAALFRSGLTAVAYEDQEFHGRSHTFSHDASATGAALPWQLLMLAMNNRPMLEFVRQITGCPGIAGFHGRLYKLRPQAGDYLDWHDDGGGTNSRLVAVSINLGTDPYVGGTFQLREKLNEHLLAEVPCQPMGTAHLFRVAAELEHRVTSVEGNAPRIAAAGWFVSTPDAATIIGTMFGKQQNA